MFSKQEIAEDPEFRCTLFFSLGRKQERRRFVVIIIVVRESLCSKQNKNGYVMWRNILWISKCKHPVTFATFFLLYSGQAKRRNYTWLHVLNDVHMIFLRSEITMLLRNAGLGRAQARARENDVQIHKSGKIIVIWTIHQQQNRLT